MQNLVVGALAAASLLVLRAGRSGMPAPRRLVSEAQALLRQHLREPLSIAQICDTLGVSPRSLRVAFRSHLDTTPMAHFKRMRLTAARKALLNADQKTRVTDVALDWGFLHFGWFSQDYRRLFIETPSSTLRRCRRRTHRNAGPLRGPSPPPERRRRLNVPVARASALSG